MTQLKVLITGAGIAGNALAFWLSKLGHDITVIERFPSLRATGLQIDLRGHGIEVMRRMCLEKAFREKIAPEQGLQIVDSSGRRRAYFPANKSGKGMQSFTTDWEIMRGDLCRLMYDATKSRAKYIFGTSVESYKDVDRGVEVRFADGRTEQFDLLVGADGQWSKTRRMMLGPDKPDAFYPLKGTYVGYFTIKRPIKEGEEYVATAYIGTGRRGVMTRRHSPEAIQVLLGCSSDSERFRNIRPGDTSEEKAALTEVYEGAGWQIPEFLEEMKTADDFYCERMGLVKLEAWSRGRVTVVGDAAYCPSANTGMGTTSGLVGAYILAGEIGRHFGNSKGVKNRVDGVESALQAYEQKFRPFMDQVQKGVLEKSPWDMMPSSPFGLSMMNYLIGIVSFFRLDFIGKYLLKEGVQNWDLPEYEEMAVVK